MLSDIPLFQDLREEQLEFLITLTHRFTYPKNSILLNQGERSNSLFVVLDGRLKVTAIGSEGRQTLLAFLGPGDFVGELSLLDDGPRSATVQAVEDTQTLLVTQDVFHRFVESFPETLLPMLRMMATRLRALDETVCSLSTLDVYGRVARIMLQQAVEKDDVLVVPRMTHQEIAEMVGSSREMVSRIMKDLRQGGYIRIDSKRRILIEKKLPARW
ncbi:MAG: Crp/Fnr family transcriptional regulator [Thiolinea sp.]